MGRFKFQLDSVLRHRKRVEDAQQCAVAGLEMRMMQGQRQQEELKARAATSMREIQGCLVGRIDLGLLASHRQQLVLVRREIAEASERVAALKSELEKAKSEFVEAVKRRKILEKMKEKQADEFSRGEERAEKVELDDFSAHHRR